MSESSFSIHLSEDDLSLLKEISFNNERRFQDLMQIIFAQGLDCYFCDEYAWVSKKPEDYTEEDRAQIATNKAILERDDISQLNYDERRALGFKHVHDIISNQHNPMDAIADPLITPLAKRIKQYALK